MNRAIDIEVTSESMRAGHKVRKVRKTSKRRTSK